MCTGPDHPDADAITFVGEPSTCLPWAGATVGARSAEVAGQAAQAAPPSQPPGSAAAIGQLRTQIAAAHGAALMAQSALLDRVALLSDLGQAAHTSQPTAATGTPGVPPPFFVTRVLDVQIAGDHNAGRMRTEHNLADARLTVHGQLSVAALFEAVRADRLLLAGYLADPARDGGDGPFQGTFTFHGDLPLQGETIQSDIEIPDMSAPAVRFSATCRAEGRPILEMSGGRACPVEGASAGTPRGGADLAAVARFKPLARSRKRSLNGHDIGLLAQGRMAQVFGAGYEQGGCNTSLRLPGDRMRMIGNVGDIDRHGGPRGLGSLVAVTHPVDASGTNGPLTLESLIIDGAAQLLQIYLLYLGAHLVLPDCRFQPMPGLAMHVTVPAPIAPTAMSLRYDVQVTGLGLVPRPHAIADIVVSDDVAPIMVIGDFGVQIKEKPHTPYRPGSGGRVEGFLGRTNSRGDRALLNEFHMAHAANGDLAVAMGPEFEIYRSRRAPHIPNGDFLFVDRMMAWSGVRGRLVPGATMVTEYDSPADSWYYRDNGQPTIPYFVIIETSLQSAVLLGYYLGATLQYPDEQFAIRSLDGRATVLKDIDLRDKTIRQHTTLLSNSAVDRTVLQAFSYDLSADGEVFYTGESLFGYFNEQALDGQAGLDSGRHVPPWLDQQRVPAARPVMRVDLREGKSTGADSSGDLRIGSGQVRLVDWVDLVPGGGDHGAGYLRGRRRITPQDWYFSCHFHRDPVMPGSLGVEAILQAMQIYVIETGLAAHLHRPRFALPAGVEMRWTYRAQIVRSDTEMDFEVHIKESRDEPGRLLLIGDASLWKSGMRIYELTDVALAIVSEQY